MIKIRNSILRFFYRLLLKPVFFLQDPGIVHERIVRFGNFLCHHYATRMLAGCAFNYQNSMLSQNILGINFKNPVGLSAGFDKDANLLEILPYVGFGFEEVGSVTAQPFSGNEGKWLYRLPEEKSLRVNYGLKNEGAEAIHKKLAGKKFGFPVGISIAKTNTEKTSHVPTGIQDYFFTYRLFQDAAGYFTINISCPNTCEAKPIFAEPENLDFLLQKLFSIPKIHPVFIKLSPDLEEEQLMKILEVCGKYPVDGFVCTNLTKVNQFNHAGKGGFSGKAVEGLSNQTISKVYKYYGGQKTIIGVGGIFTAEDAYHKIKLGASLVQLITGMIFRGPQTISEINMGLVELLRHDGYENVAQAIGKGS